MFTWSNAGLTFIGCLSNHLSNHYFHCPGAFKDLYASNQVLITRFQPRITLENSREILNGGLTFIGFHSNPLVALVTTLATIISWSWGFQKCVCWQQDTYNTFLAQNYLEGQERDTQCWTNIYSNQLAAIVITLATTFSLSQGFQSFEV